MAKASGPKVPGVLAFERKLSPSDARLYSIDWQQRNHQRPQPLPVVEKALRGTISNRQKKTGDLDPAKFDAQMENPNLQTVDVCNLPAEHDTLVVRFTLKIIAGVGQPSACNSSEFRQLLQERVDEYLAETSATELGRRYATNLANGRFLWRNRVGAQDVEVTIEPIAPDPADAMTFDATQLPLSNFDSDDDRINELGDRIAATLRGDNDYLILDITAYVRTGAGQEVFPSQELMQDAPSGKGAKSKYLYSVDGMAGIHSQKLGNAIRTIDTWYMDSDEIAKPIAVESYGSVTTEGKAYRNGKNAPHFYKLFDNWSLGKDISPEQKHYVVAMLVRGGVFGKSEAE